MTACDNTTPFPLMFIAVNTAVKARLLQRHPWILHSSPAASFAMLISSYSRVHRHRTFRALLHLCPGIHLRKKSLGRCLPWVTFPAFPSSFTVDLCEKVTLGVFVTIAFYPEVVLAGDVFEGDFGAHSSILLLSSQVYSVN